MSYATLRLRCAIDSLRETKSGKEARVVLRRAAEDINDAQTTSQLTRLGGAFVGLGIDHTDAVTKTTATLEELAQAAQ